MPVHVPDDAMRQLSSIFEKVLRDQGVEVILFGSRATNQHRADSDIDLALRGTKGRDGLLKSLKKELQKGDFNIEVELVAEEEASAATMERIKNEGIRIWPD